MIFRCQDLVQLNGYLQMIGNENSRLGGIQVLRHQMMMFDDKVGEREWLNDDVIKKYTRK